MQSEKFEFQSLGSTLRGQFFRVPEPTGTVLCLTGDGKNGSQSSTWPSLIGSLNTRDIEVCIFDFVSQGLSSGERSSLCLSAGVQNLSDFMKFVRADDHIRTLDFGCIASSFGAAVATNSPELPGFSKLSLKSPAFVLHEAYEREIGGIDQLSDWQKSRIHPELGLSFEAYIDSLSSKSYKGLLSCKGPILITIGDQDEVVGVADSKRAALINPSVRLQLLSGVKHDYKQEGAREKFEILNCDFFGAAQ